MIPEFEQHGFAVRRGMVPPAELDLLRATHARMFADREKVAADVDERARVTLERVRDPARDCPELLETSFWIEGCAMAARLLEGDRFHATIVLQSKPPGAPASPLHQHVGQPRPEVSRDVSLWMPLEDCVTDNGCLLVVPGSHKRVLPHDPHKGHRGRLTLPWPVPERLPLVAGDAVWVHEGLVHGTEANVTHRPRGAVVLYAWLPNLLAA